MDALTTERKPASPVEPRPGIDSGTQPLVAEGSCRRPEQLRRHLRAWWSVVRWGLCVVAVAAVLSLSALPWFHLSWWQIFRRCVSIASALSLWFCIRYFEHRSIRSYGLAAQGAWKRQFFFGLFLGLGVLGLLLQIGLASGACWLEAIPDHLSWLKILGFLPVAVLISVLEELAFRGFLLQQLMASSTSVAVIASSALYSLVHLKSSEWTAATFLQLGGLFLLGCVLCFSYLRTRQLYLSIGLHASLAYGAGVNKIFVGFRAPGDTPLDWLIGTSRLVNGLASWAALIVIAAVVAWWTREAGRSRRS